MPKGARNVGRLATCLWCGTCPLAGLLLTLGSGALTMALVLNDACGVLEEGLASPEAFDRYVGGERWIESDLEVGLLLRRCVVEGKRLSDALELESQLAFVEQLKFPTKEEAFVDATRLDGLVYDAIKSRGLGGSKFVFEDSSGRLPRTLRTTTADPETDPANEREPGLVPGMVLYLEFLNSLVKGSPNPLWSFYSLEGKQRDPLCIAGSPEAAQAASNTQLRCQNVTWESPTDTEVMENYMGTPPPRSTSQEVLLEAFRVARLKESVHQEPFREKTDGPTVVHPNFVSFVAGNLRKTRDLFLLYALEANQDAHIRLSQDADRSLGPPLGRLKSLLNRFDCGWIRSLLFFHFQSEMCAGEGSLVDLSALTALGCISLGLPSAILALFQYGLYRRAYYAFDFAKEKQKRDREIKQLEQMRAKHEEDNADVMNSF